MSQHVAKPAIKNRITADRIANEVRARRLAQAWVRYGMDMHKAFIEVTGRDFHKTKNSITQLTNNNVDAFVDEVRVCVDRSDIDKSAALNLLWTILQASIVDFFDENGRMLTVRELKKLPRVYQQIIQKMKVRTWQKPLKDKDGNLMFDDNGRPYVMEESEVELEILPKIEAIKQLALIMKWVGPATVINHNTINVAAYMVNADERVRKLDSLYEPAAAAKPAGGKAVDSGTR